MRRYLNRYLGIALAVLLMLAALFVPLGWFALRDVASVDRVHGEALSPLMVAQLDSGYEKDIHDRLSAYMEAAASQDVLCSSKEIDVSSESLWENIQQAESTLLMDVLQSEAYVHGRGLDSVIESCVQYVLMRKSDGQILLVANDIRLYKGTGCYMELLLDGVDGTIYYLESQEAYAVRWLRDWLDGNAWEWWWLLNDTYNTDEARKTAEDYSESEYLEINVNSSALYDGIIEEDLTPEEIAVLKKEWVQIFNDSYPNIWVSTGMNKDIYCCQLAFGDSVGSWAMEIEAQDETFYAYQIRLGLPGVVNFIPEMAQRISLAEYDHIYRTGE